jgi:hypothetical protein
MVAGKLAGPLQADTYRLDYGHQPALQVSGARTVTLTNVAAAGTSITDIAVTGVNSGEFQLAGGTCATGVGLGADATCTVRVAFAPATAGVKNAVVRVTPSTGPPVLVAVTGLGDPPAAPGVAVTPGVLAYGTVTAPATSTLSTTVRNTGNANLVVGLPVLGGSGAADYTVTANTCTGAPVAPAATCTITVRFRPGAIGPRTGTLTIPHNATGGQTVVSLSATGAGSTFVLSPNPVKFGTVNRNTTKSQSVGVRNSGTIAFLVTSATVTGAQSAFFGVTGPGCLNTVLQPGRSCNLSVTLRPTAAVTYTGTLVVNGDASSLPPSASAGLTGNGK